MSVARIQMRLLQKLGTQFNWKPLIQIPEVTSLATFLQGDGAQAFLKEFNATAKEKYGDVARNIRVLRYDKDAKIIRGSNPFAVVHADNILKSQGIRVATMADLEKGLIAGFDLERTYEDTDLVLKSRSEPNKYLATNLADQLDARGTKLGKNPLVVQLRGLQLVRDANSDYGLSFKLTDESKATEATQLVEENNGKTLKKLDENHMIILDAEGYLCTYPRKTGLLRVCLYRYIFSSNEFFAYSDATGRVAFVRNR